MATWIDRTQTSGNRQIFTYSAWVKFTGDNLTSYAHLATTTPNPGNWDTIRLHENRKFEIICNNNSNILRTSRVFRDINAWYHFVVAVDTTQATASNRTKLYVNGVQETSFESTGYPPQNHNTNFNTNSQTFRIGHNTWSTGGGEYFTGLMSHVHWIDGTAYDATAFGEYDANGVWKIKTSPSVTYGNNGFFILKDGNSVTDQSGNSNNFTVAGGTLTKTEDNPSNVFATLNPLINTNQTLSNGNTVVDFPLGNDAQMYSTLAFSSGKYYAEFKINSFTADRAHSLVLYTDITTTGLYLSFCKTGDANVITSFGSAVQSGLASFSAGDIIGMAVDADNGTVDFTKNGSAYGSQVTGLSSNFSGKDLFFGFYGEGHGSLTRVFNASTNFGNGYFGTTAVTTAGTNASGIGIFEYDVPTGFTALSTKGLNL